MEPGPPALHSPLGPSAHPESLKAAEGCAWQSLRCLQLHRQKKKVAYSAHICKLLNRVSPSWAGVQAPAPRVPPAHLCVPGWVVAKKAQGWCCHPWRGLKDVWMRWINDGFGAGGMFGFALYGFFQPE